MDAPADLGEGRTTTATLHVRIPEEIIIFEILPRLPVKLLLQLKLVCKLWESLLSDPQFSLPTKGREHAIFLCRRTRKKSFYSLDHQYAIQQLPDPCFYGQTLDFLGSCNGLVLFSTYDTTYSDYSCYFHLWNPSTSSCRGLVNFTSRILYKENRRTDTPVAYGLCFDKLSGDYKAAMVYHSSSTSQRALVVSLKRGITLTDVSLPYILEGTGVLANGNLHWIDKEEKIINGGDLIVCFDEATNKFSKLPTPEVVHGGKKPIYRLGILDGCLCMSRHTAAGNDTFKCELFVMGEYGVKESWATLCIISGGANLSSVRGWEPLFSTKSGEEFLIASSDRILAYNVKTESLKEIQTCPGQEFCAGPLRYVESLVPLRNFER